MRYLIYIFVALFVVCGTANEGYAQFWKKKNGTASSTSKGGSGGGKHRDAFAGKSKKGPNIYSSKPPKTKSRSKLYAHSISKKKLSKKRRQAGNFNSKKSRYKIPNLKSKGDGTSSPNSSSGGRKKGKGRKKE
ncbi:MAG: hypothetical protein KDD41_13070 [Flavobacteriales bacterium]|nr:hypothetical protein [Flavobacteriales bacterium]